MTGVPFLDLGVAHSEVSAELEDAMLRVLRSGCYLRGPEVEGFEREFARYCGVAAGVGLGNGLEALQLTLRAMGIGRGDEVIVPAHTSIATWLAVSHTGARPVPVEPDPLTMLIDPARVRDAVGARTAAILPVHLYGMPADMPALASTARQHGIALLEDASQAHGARLHGRPVGSLADAAAFSLYPTKNLGAAGDAGITVSQDARLIERVRMLGNYGERRRHDSELRGHNSRIDELQAALLRVKLQRLDGWNARRRARAEQYLRTLAGCPGLQLPIVPDGAVPVWHQFVVRVDARDQVREQLARRGVQTLIHYPIPPHRSAAYASDYADPMPLTDRVAASVLSLPISPHLSESNCALVSDLLRESVAHVAEPRASGPISIGTSPE